jgi:DnaJ-class molecular chaperone
MQRRSFLAAVATGLAGICGCIKQAEEVPPGKCTWCKGTGKNTCDTCNGSGQLPKYATRRVRSPETVPCYFCEGKGVFQCSFCDGRGNAKPGSDSGVPFRTRRRTR